MGCRVYPRHGCRIDVVPARAVHSDLLRRLRRRRHRRSCLACHLLDHAEYNCRVSVMGFGFLVLIGFFIQG